MIRDSLLLVEQTFFNSLPDDVKAVQCSTVFKLQRLRNYQQLHSKQ